MSEIFDLAPDQHVHKSTTTELPSGAKIVVEENHNMTGGVIIASVSFDPSGNPVGPVGVQSTCNGVPTAQGYVQCTFGTRPTLDCAANSFDC